MYIKPVEELTFSDDFMFGAVMKHPQICKDVLEKLLHISISRIDYPELQKNIAPFYQSHGIRLDVYVSDSDRVFDIEIQNHLEQNIGKRSRY